MLLVLYWVSDEVYERKYISHNGHASFGVGLLVQVRH